MIRRPAVALVACLALASIGDIACDDGSRDGTREPSTDGGSTDDATPPEDAGTPEQGLSGIEPNSDWRPLSRYDTYAGQTLDELALEWAHWNLSQSDCTNNPESDPDGALCTLDQNGQSPVFFIASGEYRTLRSRCSISSEQALLVPLTYFYADGVSHPFGINTPEEGLEAEALSIQHTMRDLKLVVDGLPIEAIDELVVGPIQFSQALPRDDNYYSCNGFEDVSGTLEPIYLVGYFALLPPASPGKHRIEFGGTYSYVGWDYVKRVSFTFSAE